MLRSSKVSGASSTAVVSLPCADPDPLPTDSEPRPRAVETDRPARRVAGLGETPERVMVVVKWLDCGARSMGTSFRPFCERCTRQVDCKGVMAAMVLELKWLVGLYDGSELFCVVARQSSR
jgi:hypothetical protein